MSKKELKVKVNAQSDEIISHLESMVKNLKKGTLVIQKDENFVTLKPFDELSLKIEGEQNDKKETLKIEISWRTEEKIVEDTPANLVISSEEPVIEAVIADEKKVIPETAVV